MASKRPPPPDQLTDPALKAVSLEDRPPESHTRIPALDPTTPALLDGPQPWPEEESAKGRILVADDDPMLRSLMSRTLERVGYDVVLAADGVAAMEAVASGGIDLALLDVQMPRADGIEVCTEIRRSYPSWELPVVIVTGLADRNARVWCKAVGADEFLTKPMDETELLIRVDNLLKLKRFHGRLVRDKEQLEDRVTVRTARIRSALEEAEVRGEELVASMIATLRFVCAASEYRDLGGAKHVDRVGAWAYWLARAAGLSSEEAGRIEQIAPLHDLGMVGVPLGSLAVRGPLNDRQRRLMERHPAVGHWILTASGRKELDLAATVAHYHHERWDGSGYPEGLVGDATPLPARIVGLADTMQAMTSDRPWRKALGFVEVMEHLHEGSGALYDPDLVDAVLAELDTFRLLAKGREPARKD